MAKERTKEPQYQKILIMKKKKGLAAMGSVASLVWRDDPKHLLFMMARYKFVAKMLSGKKRVLEVGCGDAFCSRIVAQEVGRLCAVDFDPVFVEDARARMEKEWAFDCAVHDILTCPVKGSFDAAYSLDVLEHISRSKEKKFIANINASLTPQGVLIIGTPSRESQRYASARSRKGHVNCMDHARLKALLSRYFYNVFIFSMNDEVIHTGFYPMAHYLFALCAGKKASRR